MARDAQDKNTGPVSTSPVRWYGTLTDSRHPRMPVQANRYADRIAGQLPESVVRMAYEQYARHGHGDQSLERLNERGGFGVVEVIALLADAVNYYRDRAFRPVGDNHHNAEACPYCNPDLR